MSMLDTLASLPAPLRAAVEVQAEVTGHPLCETCLSGTPCSECPKCLELRKGAEGDEVHVAFLRMVEEGEEPSEEMAARIEAAQTEEVKKLGALARAADVDLEALAASTTDRGQLGRIALARLFIDELRTVDQERPALEGGKNPVDAVRGAAAESRAHSETVLADLPPDDAFWALWMHVMDQPWTAFMLVKYLLGDEREAEAQAYEEAMAAAEDETISGSARVAQAILSISSRDSDPTDEQREEAEDLIREIYADAEGLRAVALSQLDMSVPEDTAIPVGSVAPGFELPTADGEGVVSLAQFAGRPVFLEFTGSWCGPCQFEIPHVRDLHDVWADRGVAFVWISLEPKPAVLPKYLADKGVTWDVAVQKGGGGDGVVADYGVPGVPAFFLIDHNGVVLANDLRPSTHRAQIEEILQGALEDAAAAQAPVAGAVTA